MPLRYSPNDYMLAMENGLLIHPAKFVFGVKNIEILRHRVTSEIIKPLGSNVKALRDFPRPTSIEIFREFLRLLNFNRRFLPNIARIVIPLTELHKTTKAPHYP
ncbi:hypothetical protein MRX96_008731 [Rhipicephalus microplus]